MRRRSILAAALTAVALGPWAHAAEPQVTDPANDANFTAQVIGGGTPTAAGSQGYADVLTVLWEKVGSDVRVTANFTAAPTPPSPTSLVYRMLGTAPGCDFVGVVWYSTKSSDPAIPKSAVRDYCTGETVLTEIAEPKVDGTKLIWTAPLSKFPAKALAAGTLTDLRVEIRELQDWKTKMPDESPRSPGAYGEANGLIEVATSTAAFSLR